MTPDLGHHEVMDLLGPFALDALDPTERELVEAHIETCPRCRAEADELREIAAALGTTVETPPAAVWGRIASQLSEKGAPPPLVDEEAAIPAADSAALRAQQRGRPRRKPILAAIAAAAVVLAGTALGVGLARHNGPAPGSNGGTAQSEALQSALSTPGHRLITLASADGQPLGQLVILPSGLGLLVRSSLPALPSDETYQLWAMVQDQPISVGLLGPEPRQASFTVAGTNHPSAFAITVEPAGGVAVPDRTPIASGLV